MSHPQSLSKLFKQIIDSAQDGIVVYGTDLRYLFWNPFMEQLTGLSSNDVIGKHALGVFPFLKAVGIIERLEKVLQGEVFSSVEFPYDIPELGISGWASQTISPLLDDEGKIVGILGIVRDITEHKKAEEALLNEKAFLRSLIDSADDVIYFKDKNGRYLGCNKAAEKFIGIVESEQIGKLDFDFFEREIAEHIAKQDQQVLVGGKAVRLEERVTIPDAESLIVETVKAPIYGANGQAIGLVGVSRDITEQKLADEALQKSNKELRLAQRIAKIGNWALDTEIGVPEWSDEVYKIYERDPKLGPFSLDEYKQLFIGKSLGTFTSAIQSASQEGQPYDIEVEVQLASGKVKWVHAICDPERKPESKGYFLRGTIQDITAFKRSEEQRLKLEGQLRQSQKMEAIGTLAGGVAHDFNNLLAIISGNLELINFKNLAGKPVDENLEQIKEASVRAKNLVTQILAFSRQEKQDLVSTNLTSLVIDSLKFLRPMIPTTVEVITEAPEGRVSINADTTKLQQILINLCSNAIHAMNEKGVLRISLDAGELTGQETSLTFEPQPGHYAKLSVADTGKGMDKETLDQAFTPFFTTKEVGSGTGMGLSVVHGITEQHGGFIHVVSTPGQGTTFTLYFPVTEEADATQEAHTEADLPTGVENILIIDDEQYVADVCAAMLEHLGYKVSVMTNSVEALAHFKAHPDDFDLIVTDQTMPKMSGVELAKELLAIRAELPVVLCSGYSATVNEETAKEIGIRAFCEKPIEMRKLGSVVREVLDTAKQS
jgi:PAS domain S-box-containing protein